MSLPGGASLSGDRLFGLARELALERDSRVREGAEQGTGAVSWNALRRRRPALSASREKLPSEALELAVAAAETEADTSAEYP